MIHLALNDSPKALLDHFMRMDANLAGALALAGGIVTPRKPSKEVEPYQAAALYVLAGQYVGGDALELGTYYGYSAAVIAQAIGSAGHLTTINLSVDEAKQAARNLATLPNVTVIGGCTSWDWLARYPGGAPYAFIFVDGDHKRIAKDLPWWERLMPGGLILFHDYTPEGKPRHCPPVYDTLNAWLSDIGRAEFDVSIVDDSGIGMVGLYK